MTVRPLLASNPELQRLLWLEFSPTRLVVMPLLVVVVFGGLAAVGAMKAIAPVMEFALFLLLILWGTRLAVETVSEELAQRTWDVQRLSATSPWGIALGKLIGGASYAWYGTIACIVVGVALSSEPNLSHIVALLIGGIAGQAGALFASMSLYRLGRQGRSLSATGQILGLGLGVAALGMVFPHLPTAPGQAINPRGFFPSLLGIQATGPDVVWYGLTMTAQTLRLLVVAALGIWCFIGTAVNVLHEMGERNGPWAWTLFIVFLCALVAGLDDHDLLLATQVPLQVALIAVGGTYIALFYAPMSRTDLKRIRIALRAERWSQVWQDLPAWVPSAFIAIVAGGVLTVTSSLYWIVPGTSASVHFGPAAVFGYVGIFLRDVALICAIRLRFERRTGVPILVLFILFYIFFPAILVKAHLPNLAQAFVPFPNAGVIGAVGPWVMAAAALVLLVRIVMIQGNVARSPTQA